MNNNKMIGLVCTIVGALIGVVLLIWVSVIGYLVSELPIIAILGAIMLILLFVGQKFLRKTDDDSR